MTLSSLDFTEMTKGSRIHGSLYCDPDVFERELEAIWYKVWVYVGHDSEIPAPGDYVRRQIGLQPVIMVRGDDGGINIFYNRCRHRGNLVCHRDRGSAATLVCPYHGWTYSRSGELVAPTFEGGYDDNLEREEFGLTPVARVDSYRGLVFASLSPEGVSLDEPSAV